MRECLTMNPWIAVEPNEGASHRGSSSLNSWLEFSRPHRLMMFLAPPHISHSALPQPAPWRCHPLITMAPLLSYALSPSLCVSPSLAPVGSGGIIGSRGSSLSRCWGQSSGKPLLMDLCSLSMHTCMCLWHLDTCTACSVDAAMHIIYSSSSRRPLFLRLLGFTYRKQPNDFP